MVAFDNQFPVFFLSSPLVYGFFNKLLKKVAESTDLVFVEILTLLAHLLAENFVAHTERI